MKFAIYIRVSKRDLNPENQKRELIEYAEQKKWEYKVFEEIESTRKTRPIKQNLLTLLRKGVFKGVLVWKLDRWARSLQELIMDINDLKNRGKHFIVLTQPIDTTNPSGMLMMQILGAFAEFEREIIRERTIAGLERAKAQGKKLGRPRGSSKPIINDLGIVNKLLTEKKSEREIAEIMKTSRYRIQEAIKNIKKIDRPNTGGGLT